MAGFTLQRNRAAPLNAKAVAIVESLRSGDFAAFDKEVAADPKLLNARGPEGSTPFMYAVVYGTADKIESLLQKGADPNAQNDAGATALMWAATDLSKTRVLLRHHADVNARSNDMRTPLIVAARKPGNVAVVRLLLDNGANPNPNAHPLTEGSPLTEAALSGDPAIVELLLVEGRGRESHRRRCHFQCHGCGLLKVPPSSRRASD